MATKTIGADYRRMDDKRTLWTPYWLTSGEIKGADLSDTEVGILWSFPAEKYDTRILIIKNILIQVSTVFAGGTPTLDVGAGTLATDDVTAAGLVTVVDDDEYIPNADVTATSAATYWAATGDWITAYILGANAAPCVITPADTTVPCVYALGAASMASGVARVLMEVCEVPTL